MTPRRDVNTGAQRLQDAAEAFDTVATAQQHASASDATQELPLLTGAELAQWLNAMPVNQSALQNLERSLDAQPVASGVPSACLLPQPQQQLQQHAPRSLRVRWPQTVSQNQAALTHKQADTAAAAAAAYARSCAVETDACSPVQQQALGPVLLDADESSEDELTRFLYSTPRGGNGYYRQERDLGSDVVSVSQHAQQQPEPAAAETCAVGYTGLASTSSGPPGAGAAGLSAAYPNALWQQREAPAAPLSKQEHLGAMWTVDEMTDDHFSRCWSRTPRSCSVGNQQCVGDLGPGPWAMVVSDSRPSLQQLQQPTATVGFQGLAAVEAKSLPAAAAAGAHTLAQQQAAQMPMQQQAAQLSMQQQLGTMLQDVDSMSDEQFFQCLVNVMSSAAQVDCEVGQQFLTSLGLCISHPNPANRRQA